MAIFFNFSPTSNHLHPLQVENYDSNSRLVVNEDDNGNLGLKGLKCRILLYKQWRPKGFFNLKSSYKCLYYLFLIHSNTYVMGLRPLEIF